MALKVAIVGLPNVGKSTLFNALTQTASAQAANYPFCTIEPNIGDVAVPEPRLEELVKIHPQFAAAASLVTTLSHPTLDQIAKHMRRQHGSSMRLGHALRFEDLPDILTRHAESRSDFLQGRPL